MTEIKETMLNIAINDLAVRSLNLIPSEPSLSTAEAIDGLETRIRQGTLAISLALVEVAEAIRETNGN